MLPGYQHDHIIHPARCPLTPQVLCRAHPPQRLDPVGPAAQHPTPPSRPLGAAQGRASAHSLAAGGRLPGLLGALPHLQGTARGLWAPCVLHGGAWGVVQGAADRAGCTCCQADLQAEAAAAGWWQEAAAAAGAQGCCSAIGSQAPWCSSSSSVTAAVALNAAETPACVGLAA